jgi:hypothetical protein
MDDDYVSTQNDWLLDFSERLGWGNCADTDCETGVESQIGESKDVLFWQSLKLNSYEGFKISFLKKFPTVTIHCYY